jgi:hypothetical protein
MRVVITLSIECKILVSVETGAKYLLHICPLMFSRAPTVDLEHVRAAAIQAYLSLSGGSEYNSRVPSEFGIELQCVTAEDMTFRATTRVPFDGNAQMLTKTQRPKKRRVQSNTMLKYLAYPANGVHQH